MLSKKIIRTLKSMDTQEFQKALSVFSLQYMLLSLPKISYLPSLSLNFYAHKMISDLFHNFGQSYIL